MASLIDVVLPVFGMIFCGYLISRLGILGPQGADTLNRFVYYVAFPALLFVVVARTSPEQILNWPFLGAWVGGLTIVYVLTAILSLVFYRGGLADLGMRGMNATCANTAFIGIPLCVAAFGEAAVLPAVLATTILATLDVSVTVLLIEIERNSQADGLRILRNILISLAKNPLMVAVFLGAVVAFAGGTLPEPLARFCELVGAAAIPCSLFALGLFIAKQSMFQHVGEIGLLSGLKLVVHPLVTWLLIQFWFPLDPQWTAITVLLAALPPAATTFVIAQRYDTHVLQTSGTLVISTLASLVTSAAVLTLLTTGP